MTAGDALRRRFLARAGLVLPDLPLQAIEVAGVTRTFVAVPGPPDAPLLIVLHGAGGTGLGMAALCGLHERGPAAGCAVVFPDGVAHVWNDNRVNAPRLARRRGVDDVAFLEALVEHARHTGLADGRRVFAVGISNGGLLAEHVARHGLLELTGIVLVAAGATAGSRAACPVPKQASAFLAFHGTADPLVPYHGGPIGWRGRRAGRRPGPVTGRGAVAPIEDVASDWSPATGPGRLPSVDRLAQHPGDFPVDRLSWPGASATAPGPTLYRVIGGGHTWPGGAQYLPARLVGPVARQLDATGITLDFVRA